MEDDNPKEIFWVLGVIGVVEKRRTREWAIYKHGPPRLKLTKLLEAKTTQELSVSP